MACYKILINYLDAHEEFRKVEHCSLDKDLFLQKPISNDDLITEINRKISSPNRNRGIKLGPFPNDDNN